MDQRLPAHLEVSAMIRQVNGEGGFGTVISRGEQDAGTILVVLIHNGQNARSYERMPMPNGTREWACSKLYDPENPFDFQDYLTRRKQQDPDLWVVELDVQNAERFIGVEPSGG